MLNKMHQNIKFLKITEKNGKDNDFFLRNHSTVQRLNGNQHNRGQPSKITPQTPNQVQGFFDAKPFRFTNIFSSGLVPSVPECFRKYPPKKLTVPMIFLQGEIFSGEPAVHLPGGVSI